MSQGIDTSHPHSKFSSRTARASNRDFVLHTHQAAEVLWPSRIDARRLSKRPNGWTVWNTRSSRDLKAIHTEAHSHQGCPFCCCNLPFLHCSMLRCICGQSVHRTRSTAVLAHIAPCEVDVCAHRTLPVGTILRVGVVERCCSCGEIAREVGSKPKPNQSVAQPQLL